MRRRLIVMLLFLVDDCGDCGDSLWIVTIKQGKLMPEMLQHDTLDSHRGGRYGAFPQQTGTTPSTNPPAAHNQ